MCGTDVEFYRRPFTTTIHADIRADAPAELLSQLDALGLLRCGTEPSGLWHQVPDGLDEAAGRRLACDAATALTKAGWKINIDPGLLTGRADGAPAGAVIANQSHADQDDQASPVAGTTPRIRGIAAPSTDRYPALLALDTAHLLDRVTESLIRADRNTAGFILATSVAPHISPLAALGRLLSAAGTHLHGLGKADQSHLFATAADTLTHLTEDLNAPARSGTAAQPSAHTVHPQPTPPPPGTPRKRR
ncbi:hypothetical protein [Streptomyces sp. HPF1205]|uniref:hypothetical protein n=1 Tax=Streptomyces sp. HPF1205 TaxID=2873262 RepID=UPI001CED3788|nr:hypothetical protein [Streptomyces sp. HPF1205]